MHAHVASFIRQPIIQFHFFIFIAMVGDLSIISGILFLHFLFMIIDYSFTVKYHSSITLFLTIEGLLSLFNRILLHFFPPLHPLHVTRPSWIKPGLRWLEVFSQ